MNILKTFLLDKEYTSVKLKLTKTNHFEIKAMINSVKGRFILDTGASSSCVDFEVFDKFKLKVKDSEIKTIELVHLIRANASKKVKLSGLNY